MIHGDDLVGTHEIALMLGVSRQRAHQLSQTKGFPEPVARLRSATIWSRRAVVKWAKATGRM